VSTGIDNYDDVLEELAEKYGSGSTNLRTEAHVHDHDVGSDVPSFRDNVQICGYRRGHERKSGPRQGRRSRYGSIGREKSREENNSAMGMAGMMGNLFKSGSSKPMERPDTSDVDELLQEYLLSESDASEPGSLLDEIDEDSRKVVMDI
jgi:hypothetical protein